MGSEFLLLHIDGNKLSVLLSSFVCRTLFSSSFSVIVFSVSDYFAVAVILSRSV